MGWSLGVLGGASSPGMCPGMTSHGLACKHNACRMSMAAVDGS